MLYRKMQEWFFRVLMGLSLTIVLGSLLTMLCVLAWRGAGAISPEILFQTPKGGYYLGGGGGIANAIVGSLYLALGGTVLATLMSLPLALALQREYASPRLARLTRLTLDVLAGTPSIVYGVLGFVIMVRIGMGASLIGGILTLTFLMLPIMTCAMAEVIALVPREMKETAYGLGATRWESTLAVVVRQSLPGLITAVLLAFGRGIGDAASVLFTAGFSDRIPTSLADPTASLPLAVFFQIGSPVKEVQERGYASALVLLVLVLLVSLVSRVIGRRFSRHVIR